MTLIEMDFFPSNFMFQTPPPPPPPPPHESDHQHHHHHEVHTSLPQMIPSCSSQDFLGVASLLGKRSSMSFTDVFEETTTHGDADEFSDDGSQAGEKKRRLNMEQVKTLEKNFELGNKLEPERKMQLARALGMQPRQIAIWFQNRRARWKTKQLEKDYDVLKRQFDAVKAQNDALLAQNQKLQAEIMAIKNKEPTESINLNIIKEREGSSSNRSDENSSDDVKLDISRTPLAIRPSSGLAQLFQTSSRPELQFQKTDQIGKEESLISNIFCNVDEQTSFWPWLEPQHFN